MRYLFGFLCVCALGVVPLVGCSETSGGGGSGGSAGTGGIGGDGGSAGTGGMGGEGGSGGVNLCEGLDCDDENQCTDDVCDPAEGLCDYTPVNEGTDCSLGDLPGVCVEGDCQGLCEGVTCEDIDCRTNGVCDPNNGMCDYTLVEDGTACSLGECLNGVCALGMPITVACTDNIYLHPDILRFDLKVEPGLITAGSPFTADLTGLVFFPESWLDWLHEFRFAPDPDAGPGIICGGVRTIGLVDLAGTVSVRSGASGADVELGLDVAALSPGSTRLCNFPRDQICTADTECLGGTCNPPILLQDIPVIDGIPLSPGGCEPDTSNCPTPGPPTDCDCSACAALDPPGCGTFGPRCLKSDQCERNGFCVNGDLPLRLEQRTGNYTADPVSGTPILFGWFDGNPPPTNPDGTIQLPPASFANPVPPIGVRWFAGVPIPFQCLMGVDSGGPYGVGVPDKASPTPDSLLITFLVP